MVIKSMKFYVMTWKVDEIVRWILFFAIFFSLQCVCLSFSPHNTHSIWHITSLTEMMNFNKAKQKKKVWINTHCLLRILPPIWITKHIINELFRRNKFQSIWKCSKCYGTYHSIRYDSGQCRYYCVLFLFCSEMVLTQLTVPCAISNLVCEQFTNFFFSRSFQLGKPII